MVKFSSCREVVSHYEVYLELTKVRSSLSNVSVGYLPPWIYWIILCSLISMLIPFHPYLWDQNEVDVLLPYTVRFLGHKMWRQNMGFWMPEVSSFFATFVQIVTCNWVINRLVVQSPYIGRWSMFYDRSGWYDEWFGRTSISCRPRISCIVWAWWQHMIIIWE